jgi:hypothetical protein
MICAHLSGSFSISLCQNSGGCASKKSKYKVSQDFLANPINQAIIIEYTAGWLRFNYRT